MKTRWFVYGHRPSLYLHEPVKLIRDIRRNIKWAWQRLTRGWDDPMAWDVASTLSELVPILVEEMRSRKDGVPDDAFPLDVLADGELPDWAWQLGREEFDRRCDVIIEGFKALGDMIDDDWLNDSDENKNKFMQALYELKRSWNELWW